MKKIAAALASAAGALALAGTALGAPAFGVSEDGGKGGDAGVSFFATLTDIGLTQNRVTILWDPARPDEIRNKFEIDLWMPQAQLAGVRIVFAVYPARARDVTSNPGATAQFANFVRQLAVAYPQVKDFIVGNEPNQPRFWQPQFNADGSGASAAAYGSLLAQSYDALKAVDPQISVVGLGLSPRGNDNPSAPSNVSTSPVWFIQDLGEAYRKSGRTRPLMDELAFHPYPDNSSHPVERGYLWPNAGVANLDRIKQAVWDAFHGTAQPVFAEAGAAGGLKFQLDETGWQVGVPSSLAGVYLGRENVPTTDEATQARIYGQLVRIVSCDASVKSLNFFLLKDEPDLATWQSGLVRADGSRRPAYDAVKQAIAQTGGRCGGTPVSWRHTTTVTGASVRFGDLQRTQWWKTTYWGFVAGAREAALFKAGVFRLPATRSAIVRGLAAARPARPVLTAVGPLRANRGRVVRFPARRLAPGKYVYAIEIRAEANEARKTTFVSRPFKVGAPKKAAKRRGGR